MEKRIDPHVTADWTGFNSPSQEKARTRNTAQAVADVRRKLTRRSLVSRIISAITGR